VNRTSHLQKEISMAQDFTSSVREKWGVYMEDTEKNYIEDTTAVDTGRSCLAEVLVEWSVEHYHLIKPSGINCGILSVLTFTWKSAAKQKQAWVHNSGRMPRIHSSALEKETWNL
jgi:hypothetical protein